MAAGRKNHGVPVPDASRMRLVRGEDGRVALRIEVADPLHTRTGNPTDRAELERVLQRLRFAIHGGGEVVGDWWQLVSVYVFGSIPGRPGLAIGWLDLSPGGGQRELAVELAEQDEVELRWVNEGIVVTQRLPGAYHRQRWLRALQTSRDPGFNRPYPIDRTQRGWADRHPTAPAGQRSVARRTLTAIPPGVPFFAARTGLTPRTGRPTLAGVRLPPGTRRPEQVSSCWASDETLADSVALAARLARAFPQTGIWPLLWHHPPEPPWAYLDDETNLTAVDAVDVASLLSQGWSRSAPYWPHDDASFDSALPRLAPPSPLAQASTANPFLRLPDEDPYDAHLMLVPCHRPADAIQASGGLMLETPATWITAVLRSWEERFGAVPVAFTHSQVWLVIQNPPRDDEQALLLAAELAGFNLFLKPMPLQQLAQDLAAAPPPLPPTSLGNADIRSDIWWLAWD